MSLRGLEYLVLDEADKMTEMGMAPQVAQILAGLARVPQTVLCSATLPRRLRSLSASSFAGSSRATRVVKLLRLGDAVRVEELDAEALDAEGREREHATAEDVTIKAGIVQEVQICAPHKKPRKLLRFLYKIRKEAGGGRASRRAGVLVFINQIKTAFFLVNCLKEHTSEEVDAIHSKMSQQDRDRVLARFKAGQITCLVATDVLGRGIHLENLPFLVNYDFPPNLLTYTHRIGRCAHQADQARPGYAFSFFTRNLIAMAPDLHRLLLESGQKIDPDFKRLVEEYVEDQRLVSVCD